MSPLSPSISQHSVPSVKVRRHWLDATEYLLLASTGVGAASAVLTQQALYAIAPLSVLVATGLWNRHRVDRLTQATAQSASQVAAAIEDQLTERISTVETTVHNRPSQQAFISFQQGMIRRNQESLARFDQQHEILERKLEQYRTQVDQLGIEHLEHSIGDLHQHYRRIDEAIDDLTTQIARAPNSHRVEAIETAMTDMQMQMMRLRVNVDNLNAETRNAVQPLYDRIDSLSLQINHVSRQTDTSTLKSEIEELIRAVTELVPRRDFMEMSDSLQQLKQQQRDLEKSLGVMGDALRTVTQDGLQLSDQQHTHLVQMTQLYQEVNGLKTGLEQITQHVQRSALLGNPAQLIEHILRRLPQTLDVTALQKQVQNLSDRLDETTQQLLQCQQQLTGIGGEASTQHHLLFDVPRAAPADAATAAPTMLERVLATVQRRLILICPWSSHQELDDRLIQQFHTLLDRGVRLDVGWCHRGDRREGRFLSVIAQRWLAAAAQRKDLQQVLNQLLPLKQQYPDLFRFKILGTNEQFLVCDHQFAILGMQDLALQNTVFPDLQAWLRTSDPGVIKQLLHRFSRTQIDEADPIAFFNRATTRYDLSDLAGALADYNQVIQLQPTDAIAYNNRGLVRYDLEDPAGALMDITQAIQLDRSQAIAYCNRGVLYSEFGELSAAIADFEQAIARMSQPAIPHFYRGTIYQKQAQLALALDDFTQAIHHAPTMPFLYCYRAALFQNLAQPDAAIADLEQAIALFTEQGDSISAQRVKRTLRSIRVRPRDAEPAWS